MMLEHDSLQPQVNFGHPRDCRLLSEDMTELRSWKRINVKSPMLLPLLLPHDVCWAMGFTTTLLLDNPRGPRGTIIHAQDLKGRVPYHLGIYMPHMIPSEATFELV